MEFRIYARSETVPSALPASISNGYKCKEQIQSKQMKEHPLFFTWPFKAFLRQVSIYQRHFGNHI